MKSELEKAVHILQRDLIQNHPEDAVKLLEKLSPAEVADALLLQPVAITVPVWEHLSPDIGIAAIDELPEDSPVIHARPGRA